MLIALCGCGKEEAPKDAAFTRLIQAPLNAGLRFQLADIDHTFEARPIVTLLLENNSSDEVWFSTPTYGARIFVYSEPDVEWTEVSNLVMTPTEGEDILVPRGQGMNWGAAVSVLPDVSAYDRPVEVRIAVVGKVYRQNVVTSEEVGAFIDVTLQR